MGLVSTAPCDAPGHPGKEVQGGHILQMWNQRLEEVKDLSATLGAKPGFKLKSDSKTPDLTN